MYLITKIKAFYKHTKILYTATATLLQVCGKIFQISREDKFAILRPLIYASSVEILPWNLYPREILNLI